MWENMIWDINERKSPWTIIMLCLVLLILSISCIIYVYSFTYNDKHPSSGGYYIASISNSTDGGWRIDIIRCSLSNNPNKVHLRIINTTDGTIILDEQVINGNSMNPWFVYNDTNQNLRIDAQDYIHIQNITNNQGLNMVYPGLYVEFTQNENLLWGPIRIP